jgi:hypothetical protein
MNTQKEITVRPDRGLTINHVVVPAHGATPDHVKESDFAGHMKADKELNLGDQKRSVVNDSVGERHTVGEAGLDVAKRRSASIEANRKASAACFDSKKLTVCPEQKGRKRK